MDRQGYFDRVATHLFNQGKQAKGNEVDTDGSCVYRGPDNTKCAIGCLIPDEIYTKDMECHTVSALLIDFPQVKEFLGVEGYDDQDFLRALQRIHDNDTPWADTANMKISLRETAQKYHLNYEVLDNLWFNDR